MHNQVKLDLAKYRITSSEQKLKASKLLLDAGMYKDSIGRSYYAIFSAMRAILAFDGEDFSKHSGVISYFQREYIKTAVFDKKYSKIIDKAFQIRNRSDYDDFYIAYKADAEEQYNNAYEFLCVVKAYIDNLQA